MSGQPGEALREIAAELGRHLEWLREAGVREVPVPVALTSTAPPSAAKVPAASAAGAATATVGVSMGEGSVAGVSRRDDSTGRAAIGEASRGERFAGGATGLGATSRAAPDPAMEAGTALAGTAQAGTAQTGPAQVGAGTEQAGTAPVGARLTLVEVRADLGDCTRCKLAGGRTHLVFGVGAADAELMFVGEGPGADEDQQGEPFVGRAGQLLTKMIEGMGYRREQVYIANVVKCRPPENRNPEPDEIAACEPFLRRQIEAVRPRVIVALGKFAAHTLLGSSVPITRLRGSWASYQGVKVMPTFHPAYLLRSPEEKGKAWADLKLVLAALGRPVPGRG